MDDLATRFTSLYDDNYRRVLSYALVHAEPHTAEDIASETFLIAWRRLAEVRDPALPWLLAVARNVLHQQRDGGRRRRVLADRLTALTAQEDLAAGDIADHVAERQTVLAAVAALSESDQETLTLVSWHGLEPRQAAKVVGCSTTAFFVRLHRARKRLAKALENGPAAAPAHPSHPLHSKVAKEAAR